MAEEKDIIGREEPLNEDASTPETADEAADETPAAGPQGKAGKFDRLTQDEGGVRKLTGMYKNWFLDYASYVILERAVPHVEDGLKPVQRRILHAMKVVDDGRYNKVANIVGQKKAREIWYLCRQYTAAEALEMGLVNKVVPFEELEAECVAWAREMLQFSPTALRFMKASFNAATDGLAGIQQLAGDATLLYYTTDEAKEGRDAFKEKRAPDFTQFPKFP